MAIPNVNQITSMLRMMDDRPQNPELQRYAQLHKNDPFLFPLIVAEDTARKQMRAAAQARAMGGEPPKVNDQAVASIGQQPMPPQGAGQVPAGLPTLRTGMANMADGGIAGYPDDEEAGMAEGGVARYNGATGSLTNTDPAVEFYSAQMRPQDDALAELQRQAYTFEAARIGAEQELATIESQIQKYGSKQRQADPEGFSRLVAARDEAKQRRDAAAKQYKQQSRLLVPQDEGERAYRNPRARTAEEAAIFNNLYATPPQGPMMPVPNVQVAGQPAAAAAAPPGAAPRPGPGPGAATRPVAAAPAAAPAAAAPSPAMTMPQPTVAGAKETAAQFLDRSALERQAGDFVKSEETAVNQARMRREAAAANQGKAYTGLEALLKKEEEGSKGQLEQAKAFALIDAGLAMAAGRSPNALQNIAEGLGVGSKRYQGAISDFNKSAKERQRAMADIEQARRAEARADTDAQLKFEERADERLANARKYGVQAIMEAGVKSADMASRIYEGQVTQAGQDRRTQMEITGRAAEGEKTRQTQVQIANIQAGTRDSPLALYRELGDGDIKRGFEIAQEGKVGGSLIKAIVEGVLKNPLMMREYPPAVQQLVNQELLKLGVSSGVTSNPPANAQILK